MPSRSRSCSAIDCTNDWIADRTFPAQSVIISSTNHGSKDATLTINCSGRSLSYSSIPSSVMRCCKTAGRLVKHTDGHHRMNLPRGLTEVGTPDLIRRINSHAWSKWYASKNSQPEKRTLWPSILLFSVAVDQSLPTFELSSPAAARMRMRGVISTINVLRPPSLSVSSVRSTLMCVSQNLPSVVLQLQDSPPLFPCLEQPPTKTFSTKTVQCHCPFVV